MLTSRLERGTGSSLSQRYTGKCFAWIAVVLMVLVGFQVLVRPVNAATAGTLHADSDVSTAAEVNSTEDSDTALGEDTPSAFMNSSSDPNNLNAASPATPLYGDVPGGGVESYAGPVTPVISNVDSLVSYPELPEDPNQLMFRTMQGIFVFNKSCPAYLSLLSLDGTILVSESYFAIWASGITTTPARAQVVSQPANAPSENSASDSAGNSSAPPVAPATPESVDSADIVYGLDTTDALPRAVAKMEICINFTSSGTPKITAKVLEVDSSLTEWQVVWVIAPSAGSQIVIDEAKGQVSSMNQYSGQQLPISKPSLEILCPSGQRFVANWSDAGSALTSVTLARLSGAWVPAIAVAFDKGKALIDPSLVAPSYTAYATDGSYQRKTFWYDSYYWVFYDRGGYIGYRYSYDGISWSGESIVPSTTNIDTGWENASFDVAQKGSKVAITFDGTDGVYFIKGSFTSSTAISWNSAIPVVNYVGNPPFPAAYPPSVAICDNGAYFVAGSNRNSYSTPDVYLKWSSDGTTFKTSRGESNSLNVWNTVLALPGGSAVFIEATKYGNTVTWSYFDVNGDLVSTSYAGFGMATGSKSDKYSVVVGSDGWSHFAFRESNGTLRYISVLSGRSQWYDIPGTTSVKYPTISFDEFGTLHVFYLSTSDGWIWHTQKTGPNYNQWSAPDLFYVSPSGITVKGLSCWMNPVGSQGIVWTETSTQGSNVKFASMPSPYGTPGTLTNPWNRDGLSPYGTYFSTFGYNIAPGSGLLTARQTEVSFPARGGLNMEVSRIFVQPKYFQTDGTPYPKQVFPFCDLGYGWSLDLPWLNHDFVCLPGSQMFRILWGNAGNIAEFENHYGTSFVLRSTKVGGSAYYELDMPSGLQYWFNQNYLLTRVNNVQNVASSGSYSVTDTLDITYDLRYRICRISDNEDPVRCVEFHYYTDGTLSYVIDPSLNLYNYYYGSIGGKTVLTSIEDPLHRITTYGYSQYGNCILLSSVRFPSQGNLTFSYSPDTSVGSQVLSWLATQANLRSYSGGPLIRASTFDYKVIGGKVIHTNETDLNEAGVVQGKTQYTFSSSPVRMIEVRKDSAGTQLSRTDSWYDSLGRPISVDTYMGASQTINQTEYAGYDDWGNVVYTRDALGHEAFASYANAHNKNSFQGGAVLSRTTSGKIFYDTFDDWDISDWMVGSAGYGYVAFDATVDPENAPSLHLVKTGTAGAQGVAHTLSQQTSDFIIEAKYMASNAVGNFFYAMAGGALRLYIESFGNSFLYWSGSYMVPFASFAPMVWYDIGFAVHYGNNTYDIYIDGVHYGHGPLINSGYINSFCFQAGDNPNPVTTLYMDSVRIYRDTTVALSVSSDYVADLYDSSGKVVDKSKNGALQIPQVSPCFPGSINLYKLGIPMVSTPMTDVWGGDVYTLATGKPPTPPLNRTILGFGWSRGHAADEPSAGPSYWPSGSTPYGSVTWVNDSGYAVSGSWYRVSSYTPAVGYQGFYLNTPPQMWVNGATDVFVQYVWLTDNSIPAEIMTQYFVSGYGWVRAYWGGGASQEDIISDSNLPVPSLAAKRIGDVPQATGRWLQLVVKASDLGVANNREVYGIINGIYCGAARWDFSSVCYNCIWIKGVPTGYSATVRLTNNASVTGIAGSDQTVILWLPSAVSPPPSVNVYPASGSIIIASGTALIYESPWLREIYVMDEYTYSTPNFYPNSINNDAHNRPVGTFQYQDYAMTVRQESYLRYDPFGNNVETKSSLGSGWTISQAGYDPYGNRLWRSDPTGRMTFVQYLANDSYTYPYATRVSGQTEYFDTVNGWTNTTSASFLKGQYASGNSFSPAYSVRLNFTGARSSATSNATMVKEYSVNHVSTISVRVLLDTYSHNNESMPELMDSGIRMKLYDSSGNRIATYTYWLSCWSYNSDNRTPAGSDRNVKVVSGTHARGQWFIVLLSPDRDWTNILWSSCVKVRFELYVNATGAVGDSFKIYYDDFTVDSATKYSFDALGRLSWCVDPLGQKTNWSYDDVGRVVWAQYPDGSHVKTTYDDGLNTATVLDQLNHKTVCTYDHIGRLVKVERFAGGASNYSWERYTYNWQDEVSVYLDTRGHVTTSTYDCLGRLTKVTHPDLNFTTVTYDDLRNKVTTETYNRSSGAITHRLLNVYDDLGRLNKTIEYKDATTPLETLMAYDAVGNLLTVKDERTDITQVTRMTYDILNRPIKNVYPDGFSDNVTYDAAGRVICKMDRENNLTFTAYDSAGRVAKVASANDIITFKYGAAGQKTEARNMLGVTAYGYNSRGMMTSLSQSIVGSNTYVLSFAYDSENRLTSVTYPDATVNYYYDWLDRVRDVKKGATQLLNITYNKDDSIAAETTGESNSNYVKNATYTYTNRDWIDTIVMKRKTTTKLSLDYNYDDVGNVVRLTDVLNSKVERYTYDWLDRLTSASGGYLPSGLTYTYDVVGNRLTCGSTSYNYGLNNKLTSDSTWTYSYDANGNIAHKSKTGETWGYTFNSLDQLTTVVKSGTTLGQYKYDANGMRANTTEGTTPTYTDYVFLGHDPLLERSKIGSTKTTTDYVYVNGRLKMKLVGSNTYYYFTDALSSVRQIWQYGSSSSASFSAQTYKPFGTAVGVSGTDQKWKYAGEALDSATGLYYIGARYMDPELGRWLSLDTELGSLSFPQTQNRYSYCVNNPLCVVDPTGRYVSLGGGGEFGGTWVEFGIATSSANRLLYGTPNLAGLMDSVMTYVGFVPGLDVVSDIYFTIRAMQEGDWANVALYGGCIFIPGLSGSYVRGAKVGLRYADDVLRHADDVPTPPRRTIRSVDEAIEGTRYTYALEQDTVLYRVYGGGTSMKGSWFAPSPPPNRQVARELYSLPPKNTAEYFVPVWAPRGTIVETSLARPWFGHPGFGMQVRIVDTGALLYGIPRWLG